MPSPRHALLSFSSPPATLCSSMRGVTSPVGRMGRGGACKGDRPGCRPVSWRHWLSPCSSQLVVPSWAMKWLAVATATPATCIVQVGAVRAASVHHMSAAPAPAMRRRACLVRATGRVSSSVATTASLAPLSCRPAVNPTTVFSGSSVRSTALSALATTSPSRAPPGSASTVSSAPGTSTMGSPSRSV